MRRLLLLSVLILLALAACQPQVDAPRLVITPFPTMTPGRVVVAPLPPREPAGAGQIAPATAVAIARQPTATANFSACLPLTAEVPLEATPPVSRSIIVEEIVRYLAAGGNPDTLARTLRETWAIIGEQGTFRADLDLTGEGTPEVLITYTVPDAAGALLIVGCMEGTYQALYEAESDTPEPPQIVVLGDLNNSGTNDLLFAARACERDETGQLVDFDDCQYRTRLMVWQAGQARFTSLLPENVLSVNPAEVTDFDNDQVSEVVVRLESNGTLATGPLRTGVNVYDWDGVSYPLSIVQLNPPRYRIQIIHEADRIFNRREWAIAIPVYQLALQEGGDLRYWFDDEPEILRAYTLYKLVVAQVAASDPGLALTQQELTTRYPDPLTAPVYVSLAQAFLGAYQSGSDVRSACGQVRVIIDSRPETLNLLNRYGTRNQRYTAPDLCPF